MVDIGDILTFRPPGADDGRPPLVKIASLFNRPIRVVGWEVKPSRFNDCMRDYADVECVPLDTSEPCRFHTGSVVICDQLNQVSKSIGDGAREFTCVIRAQKSFVKMYPCKEQSNERPIRP